MKSIFLLTFIAILSFSDMNAQIELFASQEGVSRKQFRTIEGDIVSIQRESQAGSPDNGDINLQKFDEFGNLLWSRFYGGTGYEYVGSFTKTSDRGFLVIGTTSSFGNGNNNIYLVKTDDQGNQEWSKTYGGFFNEYGKFIKELPNGNIIVKGQRQICEGKNVGSNCRDEEWVFEVDQNGDLLSKS